MDPDKEGERALRRLESAGRKVEREGEAEMRHAQQRVFQIVATCSYNYLMRSVGIRELKNRLSEYLRLVYAGEAVLITDHGRVVAEIHPPDIAVSKSGSVLRRMANSGLVRLGATNHPGLYVSTVRKLPYATVARLLSEERDED